MVSATAGGDSLASFTTTGTYVDLSAPGSNILTTAPGNAYQAVNGTSFSTPLVITVTVRASGDTTAPRVWFVSPENGNRVRGDVRVTIRASDNVAVTKVDFYIDNQLFTSWTRAPYTVKWKTNNAGKGNHTLNCVAFDAAGNSTTTSITVNVR